MLGDYYKPYFLAHLGANYTINKHFRVSFAIRNLFNHNFIDYVQYGWQNTGFVSVDNRYNYIQEGRNYWLGLNMDF